MTDRVGSAVETREELVGFVRNTLGCGCPDEIIERIEIDRSPTGEPGLDVGGRLLVRVLQTAGLEEVAAELGKIVVRARAERDRRGFNRLRFVVADDRPERVVEALAGALVEDPPIDDRVHVHIVHPTLLPACLDPVEAADRRPVP